MQGNVSPAAASWPLFLLCLCPQSLGSPSLGFAFVAFPFYPLLWEKQKRKEREKLGNGCVDCRGRRQPRAGWLGKLCLQGEQDQVLLAQAAQDSLCVPWLKSREQAGLLGRGSCQALSRASLVKACSLASPQTACAVWFSSLRARM